MVEKYAREAKIEQEHSLQSRKLIFHRLPTSMLVTETAETVTNISKLSPTHFVSNISRQHRCSRSTGGLPEHTVRLDSYCSIIVVRFGILVFVGLRIREVFLSKNRNYFLFLLCICESVVLILFRLNPHINGNFTFTSSAFV